MLRLSIAAMLPVCLAFSQDQTRDSGKQSPLPGTKLLERKGDLAAQMVEGIDRYLMRALDAASNSHPVPDRARLRKILGVVDPRVPFDALVMDTTSSRGSLIETGPGYEVHEVRWPVFDGVDAEGLWVKQQKPPKCSVIAIPDSDPIVTDSLRRLAASGCQVLMPVIIDRSSKWSGHPAVRYTDLSHREWIYRMAYEMGRHIIGYEVQKVLAAADWFEKTAPSVPVAVAGEGEGEQIAFYAAVVDPRLRTIGELRPPDRIWEGPIDRNVWSLLLVGFDRPSPLSLPAPAVCCDSKAIRDASDSELRRKRQFDQLVEYTQKLVRSSPAVREKFKPDRDYLWTELIGKLPAPTEPLKAESRLLYDKPEFRGYEVFLPLYPDVYAYGVLLLPKDLKPGERRPVVVTQHGLEGRPQDLVEPATASAEAAYKRYAAKLAAQGFIVFAPQAPFIGGEKFRVLVRKAHPLKLSLYSFIVEQHRRIIDWLSTQPFVDPQRIGFYGLSYGGKVAMRIPAIETRYALSICSGDFNEWIWKVTRTDQRFGYMYTKEYDMLEFDLGHTMNYSDLATLIAPRPFMVERGHRDGVGIDEWIAYEYARVRRHYVNLGIPERTEIEFFNGPHTINGVGTFEFLRKHLRSTP